MQIDIPNPYPDAIADALVVFVPNGPVTLSAIEPDAGMRGSATFQMPEGAEDAAKWAVEKNVAGNNVYWGVNLSNLVNRRSKEEDIVAARFVWSDIDPKSDKGGTYATARAYILDHILPEVEPVASIVVDSGNGLQAFFRLKAPVPLTNQAELEAYKSLNKAIGYRLHGGGTQNADRILRLPGTLNYPNLAKLKEGYPKEPSMARLLCAKDLTYDLAQLRELSGNQAGERAALPALGSEGLNTRFNAFLRSNSKAAKRYAGDPSGLNDISGSGFDMSLFGLMKRSGFSKDEIATLLGPWPFGSTNGRAQGDRYWKRLDERTETEPSKPQSEKPTEAFIDQKFLNGITAQELSQKHFAPLNWIIPNILPEGCYLLTARPKVGKSWLGLQASLAVALGLATLGQQACQGKAVYLALEDNQRRLQDRLKQLRPEGYATPNLILFTQWPRFDAGGLDKLKELIESEKPKLIIIDTLAKVRPAATNSNVYENDYKALAPLTELANQNRCCIVVVHHNRKGKSDADALEQISGSLGLVGAVDGALVIDGVRSDKQYKLSLIGRDIPSDDELAISRKPNGEWEVLGAAQQVFISAERKQITDLLSFHPKGLKPREISDHLGKGPSATRKLLMSMLGDQQVKMAHGVYYLPPHTGNSGGGGVGGNTGNTGNA